VRIDLSQSLIKLPSEEFICIFGSEDKMTPQEILLKKLPEKLHDNVKVIDEGEHDIANSHTKKLIDEITSYTNS